MSAPATWTPLDWGLLTDPEQIDGAVANWCQDHGQAAPCWGEAFGGDWRLEIPAGSCWDGPGERATVMRVTYPDGRCYELEVDREGDLDGGSWREITYYVVRREVPCAS